MCTGGEPLLQLDEAAVEALHANGFEVAVETNGTQEAPRGLDWICVSPKAGAPLRLTSGDELKLVYPQQAPHQRCSRTSTSPDLHCSRWTARSGTRTPAWPCEYCMAHPRWRLSLQTHKYLGIA